MALSNHKKGRENYPIIIRHKLNNTPQRERGFKNKSQEKSASSNFTRLAKCRSKEKAPERQQEPAPSPVQQVQQKTHPPLPVKEKQKTLIQHFYLIYGYS